MCCLKNSPALTKFNKTLKQKTAKGIDLEKKKSDNYKCFVVARLLSAALKFFMSKETQTANKKTPKTTKHTVKKFKNKGACIHSAFN